MARPLNEATKGGEQDPLAWGPTQQKAFEDIKQALTSAPRLGLHDLTKPFFLYAHEWFGIAIGVLTQILGTWHCPVAYLSKQLDSVAQGWPPCLRALTAMSLLVLKSDKLATGQNWLSRVSHSILTLLEYKGQ